MDFIKLHPAFQLLLGKIRVVRKRARDYRVRKQSLLNRAQRMRVEKQKEEDHLSEERKVFIGRQRADLAELDRVHAERLGDFDQQIKVVLGGVDEHSKPPTWREEEWRKICAFARICSPMGNGPQDAIRKAFKVAREAERRKIAASDKTEQS